MRQCAREAPPDWPGSVSQPSVFKMSCRGVKKSKDCLGQKKITSFYCQEPKRDGGSEIGSIEGAIVGEGSRALLEDSTAPPCEFFLEKPLG